MLLGPRRFFFVSSLLFFAPCAGVITLAGDAHAQPPPTAQQRADATFKEGLELARAGKHEAALAKFEESRAAYPSARAVFQMAKMEQLLGQHDLALFHFRQVGRDDSLPAESRAEAARAIEDLKTKISVITLDVPHGASVSVDGNPVLDPSAPIEVAPGLHIVKVTLGGESRTANANCQAGKVVSLSIRFDAPSASRPASASGPATGSSPSGASPAVPGSDQGEKSFWTTEHTIGVGLAGVAVVGATLGAVFLASRASDISRQEELARDPLVCVDPGSQACREFDDAGSSASTAGTVALISFIGAAAAGAGAAILLWPRASGSAGSTKQSGRTTPSPRPTTRIVPMGAGLSLMTAF